MSDDSSGPDAVVRITLAFGVRWGGRWRFRFCHSLFDGAVTTTLFKYLVLMATDVEISETNRVCQWDE